MLKTAQLQQNLEQHLPVVVGCVETVFEVRTVNLFLNWVVMDLY